MLEPTPADEYCRNWVPKPPYGNEDRCGNPATFIIWGKMFPPEMLGPRCETCAYDQLTAAGYHTYSALDKKKGYAIYHLPAAEVDDDSSGS